jgi:hypothetical protein
MIIYTSSFVLSAAAAGQPLTHPRIGWQTFTFDLLPSAVTVSSETANGPKDAPLRPDTAEFWLPSALPATWQIDLGTTREIDYVGIAGHTIGSSGAAVLAETSMDNVVWSGFASGIAPADDAPLLFLDDVRSARYMRAQITGGTVMPRIAVIYIGDVLEMEREVNGSGFTPITLSRQTVLHRSLSSSGQFLGQGFRRNGVVGSASFRHLDPDWYRENFDPFVAHARSLPYFFGWWPEQYPEEVGFVWTDKDISGSYMGIRELMQVSWNMNGIGNG